MDFTIGEVVILCVKSSRLSIYPFWMKAKKPYIAKVEVVDDWDNTCRLFIYDELETIWCSQIDLNKVQRCE